MDELDTVRKNFYLTQKHHDFLESINTNTSLALRIVLNSIISNEKRLRQKEILDKAFIFIGMGLLLFILSYVIEDYLIKAVAIIIGAFLFAYGAAGGAIQCNIEKRRNNYQKK